MRLRPTQLKRKTLNRYGHCMTEHAVKHLEFIQNVITRMNANSFLIKGWMITLVSALFALAAKDADARYAVIIFFVIPSFWALDAFYLSLERQYRALYDKARREQETDFSMNASCYRKGRCGWFRSFISRPLLALYPPVAVLALLVMFWINALC